MNNKPKEFDAFIGMPVKSAFKRRVARLAKRDNRKTTVKARELLEVAVAQDEKSLVASK